MGSLSPAPNPAAPSGGINFTLASGSPLPTYTFSQAGTNPKNFTLSDPSLTGTKLALLNIQLSDPGNTGGSFSTNGMFLALEDTYVSGSGVEIAQSFTPTDSGGYTMHLSTGFNVAVVPVVGGQIKMQMKDGAGGAHLGTVTITILGTFA